MLTEIQSFHEGTNYRAYNLLGAHRVADDNKNGYVFRTWAPNAKEVYVTGDFCCWSSPGVAMSRISDNGVYEVTIENLEVYYSYKYVIVTADGTTLLKSDPYAYHFETRPANASKIFDLSGYEWEDSEYQLTRATYDSYSGPMNIYELHLGSWRRYADYSVYSYRDIAPQLAEYLLDMGYTHIELLPITEHPYDGSWGYQSTGYFAPTSRYGTPFDFMFFVDIMHQNNIGVILDWVPSHFPKDAFSLAMYDGGYCYEDPNPTRGEHKQWGTLVFDFGKREVQSFLISSAMFWFETYHIDGLRVDAVASMLYLDYNRTKSVKNTFGGNENLEAIDFIKKLNTAVFSSYGYALMIAEESSAWPLVTKPVADSGLGFNYKWNMGWMNDILKYIELNPFYRKDNHDKITFSLHYAFSENYILAISHDEVVHGKKSMVNKTEEDYEAKFASLRAFLTYMMAHPGKKLLFMGQEFAQFIEWDYKKELDWLLLDYEAHRRFKQFVKDLNYFYLSTPALYEIEDSWEGFRWISADDSTQNIISFIRTDKRGSSVAVVVNFSPVSRTAYRIGVPNTGRYTLLLSSDDYNASECGMKSTEYLSESQPLHGFNQSIKIDVPGYSGMFIEIPKDETSR
ncbi:MAG: 1,4-alpha-glucan branching protein GlgB [Oscillospiraceae bacterium]|nr:1,4-alpha-glucan branching protein GlgB [Oscillospiraceae bacterium]